MPDFPPLLFFAFKHPVAPNIDQKSPCHICEICFNQGRLITENGSFLRFGLESSPSSLGSITRYLITIYGNKGNFFDFYEDLGDTYRYVRLDRENDEYFFRVEEICGL